MPKGRRASESNDPFEKFTKWLLQGLQFGKGGCLTDYFQRAYGGHFGRNPKIWTSRAKSSPYILTPLFLDGFVYDYDDDDASAQPWGMKAWYEVLYAGNSAVYSNGLYTEFDISVTIDYHYQFFGSWGEDPESSQRITRGKVRMARYLNWTNPSSANPSMHNVPDVSIGLQFNKGSGLGLIFGKRPVLPETKVTPLSVMQVYKDRFYPADANFSTSEVGEQADSNVITITGFSSPDKGATFSTGWHKYQALSQGQLILGSDLLKFLTSTKGTQQIEKDRYYRVKIIKAQDGTYKRFDVTVTW